MKKGFTLAEVLITLAIIGVVTALTLPTLNTNIQKNKVGPSIRKFMTTIEEGNARIITEDGTTNKLSDIVGTNDTKYLTELNKYVKGVVDTRTLDKFTIKPTNYKGEDADGAALYKTNYKFYVFNFDAGDSMAVHLYAPAAIRGGSFKGNIANVWYDLNGFEVGPNKSGKDMFLFRIDDSGTVYPDGGRTQYTLKNETNATNYWWSNARGACNETKVGVGCYCGASVVDNGYKVVYKY